MALYTNQRFSEPLFLFHVAASRTPELPRLPLLSQLDLCCKYLEISEKLSIRKLWRHLCNKYHTYVSPFALGSPICFCSDYIKFKYAILSSKEWIKNMKTDQTKHFLEVFYIHLVHHTIRNLERTDLKHERHSSLIVIAVTMYRWMPAYLYQFVGVFRWCLPCYHTKDSTCHG